MRIEKYFINEKKVILVKVFNVSKSAIITIIVSLLIEMIS